MIGTLIARDMRLAVRQGAGLMLALAFFALVVTAVPLGIGPSPRLLASVAPGILWLAFLLASLLTLDRLFQSDYEDGSLELMTLTRLPLAMIVLTKCVAHWLMHALPLLVLAPVLGIAMQMPVEALAMLAASLLVGTPALTLIGALGAALTMGVRRGGLLTVLVVMPLYLPILIFGAGAAAARGFGDALALLAYLGAISALAVALAPLAAAAALRAHLS